MPPLLHGRSAVEHDAIAPENSGQIGGQGISQLAELGKEQRLAATTANFAEFLIAAFIISSLLFSGYS